MTYSEQTRADVAIALSCCACNDIYYNQIVEELGLSLEACYLGIKAIEAVIKTDGDWRTWFAAAEQLVQTGWLP